MKWSAVRAGFRDELSKIGEINLSGLSAEKLMSYPQPQPMPSAAYDKAQAILSKVQPRGAEKTAGDPRAAYFHANSYVYNRAAHGGVSYGFSKHKDHDENHFRQFLSEPDAVKKHDMLTKKFPHATDWLKAEGGHNYIMRHGAGFHPDQLASMQKTAYIQPDMMPQLKRLRRKAGDPPADKVDTALAYGGNVLAGTGAAKFTGDAVEKIREAMTKKTFSPKTKALIIAGGALAGIGNKIRKEHRRKKWQEGHHT